MRTFIIVLGAAAALLVSACATAPTTPEKRMALVDDANTVLQSMRSRDPGLDSVLSQSAGYVVFPEIGKGGAIVGGAYGRGIVYVNNQPIGYADLNQASIGAQLGGKTFSELIILKDERALRKLRNGQFQLGANASATVLTTGAAAETVFRDGVAVFVIPRGGLMVDVSVSGQQINFQPRG